MATDNLPPQLGPLGPEEEEESMGQEEGGAEDPLPWEPPWEEDPRPPDDPRKGRGFTPTERKLEPGGQHCMAL